MRQTARKLLMLLLTMFLVSLFVFLAFEAIAGDPAARLLGTEATPERLAALRHEMGLDRSAAVRYLNWVSAFVRGDMGTSYSYQISVRAMLAEKFPYTAVLTLMSFLLIVLFSVPIGILCGKYEGGALDRIMTVLGQFTMAIPPFFTGIVLTYLFGIVLRVFTVGSVPSAHDEPLAFIAYFFFPSLSVALPRIAMTVKLLRSSILSEAQRDYVRTSMSRGMSRTAILYRHVLKNALPPVVTFLALTVADIVAGSVIIEQVFAIPGIGRLLLASISNRDCPVVQAIVTLLALWVVLVNYAADFINSRIDPRIRRR